ncbi:MAG: tRNA (adenosine(37)-N6)-threonylcarbamoyltransferase complex transferase subunit TsaD [Patescibacteria group bacterium]
MMLILGIETSCDETAATVLEINSRRLKLRANKVASQTSLHKKWGGVVPELAARRHSETIIPLIEQALSQAKIKLAALDLIAVTQGPGLITALQVGVETAKTLAWTLAKPLIGVNHIAGHLVSPFLTIGSWPLATRKTTFPAVALVVSGGHTELHLIKKLGAQKLLGRTLDDAAGEAFDKVAKMLKLPYPGGPQVANRAIQGDPTAFTFPRPMILSPNLNFSFAGLKTSVLYTLKKLQGTTSDTTLWVISRRDKLKADICASFERAAIDVLVSKTIQATKQTKAKTVLLAGGVSANQLLRKKMAQAVKLLPQTKLLASPLEFTGDNAAMIALAGYIEAKQNGLKKYQNTWQKINANANWELW